MKPLLAVNAELDKTCRKLPTTDRLNYLFDYDPPTGALRWRVSRRGPVCAGDRAGTWLNGYLVTTVDGCRVSVHRIIWKLMTGDWPTGTIDHINGRRNDNRWKNLRDSNSCLGRHALNLANRRLVNGPLRGSQSGFKGVFKNKNRWGAQITVNYKNHYLGTFDTREEAAKAYDLAAERAFGEFAMTNHKMGLLPSTSGVVG